MVDFHMGIVAPARALVVGQPGIEFDEDEFAAERGDVFRECSGSGADFDDAVFGADVELFDDPSCDVFIDEKVLAQ